jgi:hypothetical protein
VSVISAFVAAFDTPRVSAGLMTQVRAFLEQEKASVGDFAAYAGVEELRLKNLIRDAGKSIRQEEVNSFCLAMGKGLDVVFGLPELDGDNMVREEFRLVQEDPKTRTGKIFLQGSEEEINSVDVMRSILLLTCVRQCLLRFPL